MLKEIYSPFHRHHVKMGRKRPVAKGPRFYFKKYRGELPPITLPVSCDYSGPAMDVLNDIYCNDVEGDCVIAGYYHVKGIATGNAGDLFHATSAQINADYSAIGGFDGTPGDASDSGCDEQTAIDYWTETGDQGGTKIIGALTIDPTNQQEIM